MKTSLSPANQTVKVICWIATALALSAAVLTFATPYMAAATLAYLLLNLGLIYRATPRFHWKLMSAAICLDVCIVLALEIQREAIKTALEFSLSPLQQGHIAVSSVATFFYFPILYLGWRGTRQTLSHRGRWWHIRLGFTAYVFRTAGFILMFTLLKRS